MTVAGDANPTLDLAVKLVLGALSTAGSLGQLISTLKDGSKWSKKAKEKVGPLGKTYTVIITIPHLIYKLFIFLVIAAFFIIMYAGGMILYQQTPLPWMSAVFDRAYWIILATFALIFITRLNLLSLGLLHLTRWLGYVGFLAKWRIGRLSFTPGWVNANWQLNHYEDFWAMNIDVGECKALSRTIYEDILAKKAATQPLQAPQPQNVNKNELANYLLFKCFAEGWVEQQKMDRDMVDKSQKYLAWAAQTEKHPFKPEALQRVVASGFPLYEQLKKLPAETATTPDGELPASDQFGSSMQDVAEELVQRFDGEGTRLALDLLNSESPDLLLKRLERFKRIDGLESESIRRLFLKLSIRMDVWPTLKEKVGPSYYPQNAGIATLFLNKECLKVPNETEQIDSNEGFWKLVAAAEDEVVEACYKELQEPVNKADKRAFTNAVFKCEPEQLDRSRLSDYIDLWLYRNTRQCAWRRSEKDTAKETAATAAAATSAAAGAKDEAVCPMQTSLGACLCEEAGGPWRLKGGSFVRS